MTLAELTAGESAVITQLNTDTKFSHRLADTGITVGVEIKVLRHAPFGDPTEFFVRGYRLCMRKCDTQKIYIIKNGENDERL